MHVVKQVKDWVNDCLNAFMQQSTSLNCKYQGDIYYGHKC